MNPDDDNPLLVAVEGLTKPVRSKLIQDGPVGAGLAGQKTVTVELPPLLTQLEEAIRGSIGIGGSGSTAHERNMLDGDALFRFMKISTTIKEWARQVGSPVVANDVGRTLVGWYTVYTLGPVTLDGERFYVRKMRSWADQITAKLNPPRVWDLPDACPVCGADTYWSKSTHEEYPRPLVVEYHETGPDLIQQAKAMCRACEQVWTVRELAYQLEQKASATPI